MLRYEQKTRNLLVRAHTEALEVPEIFNEQGLGIAVKLGKANSVFKGCVCILECAKPSISMV